MFYYRSTFELYAELVEPEALLGHYIKDEAVDGVAYWVMAERGNALIKKGVLGNKRETHYVSLNYPIDDPAKEGVYTVCFAPADQLYHNAASATKDGKLSKFGSVFQS